MNIVLVGSFNPSIVQPAWLAKYGLIPDSEQSDATTELIRNEFGRVSLPWVEIQVLRDRADFTGTDNTPSATAIRDLVLGCLDLLHHTPVSGLGINDWAHYRMASEAAWHAVGHRIIPPENWSTVLGKPGMMSADVRGLRPDERAGSINVTVQPSGMFQPGVFISVNDHIELLKDGERQTAGDASAVLQEVWDEARSRAKALHEHVLAFAS